MNEPPSKDTPRTLWRRRDALTMVGWTAVVGSLLTGVGAFFRLLFRRAPVQPPTVFEAGALADYRPGSVSERFLHDWRVFIVNERDHVFALHARCTHLGCTPRWNARGDKFKCPCHGSGFHRDGVNFEGPAPRPLERAKVWIDAEGRLLVDVAPRFQHDEWSDPRAAVLVETDKA
jgi:cytochrome b6-f complex iron-sulfur subunit